MIARVWHGRTNAAIFDPYVDYVRATGVQECLATPGNKGVQLLLRRDGAVGEMLFISLWDSIEAIRQFAGDELDRARYYPDDARYLLELEPTVRHFEVRTFQGEKACQTRIIAPPLIFAL